MIYDSRTATASSGGDPLAKEYLKNNVAGSGAYKVESAGSPARKRFTRATTTGDCGPLPQLRRVITRDIPPLARSGAFTSSKATPTMSYGLPPKDFKELADANKIHVAAVPVPNAI